MIKKIIVYCVIGFLISCGSSHPVVRTNKKATVSKPVVRAIRKPLAKPVAKPVVTNQVQQNSKQPDDKTVVSSQNREDSIEILEATTQVKVTTEMVLAYIEKYKGIAKEDMVQYGIPASITLGQGILESGAGTGPLSLKANNHFGIKCHKEWTGPSVRYDDDSEQECFRKYNEANESYRDHSLFLTTRDRYSNLFKLDKNDYKSWAKGLKEAGYATDPSYPTKLVALIERYQLQRFDAEVLGTDYMPIKTIQVPQTKDNVAPDKESHQVVKGDTLYSISKRYNISIDDLKKKNNISDTGISIGQRLIVR